MAFAVLFMTGGIVMAVGLLQAAFDIIGRLGVWVLLIFGVPTIGMIMVGLWLGAEMTRLGWLFGLIPPAISYGFMMLCVLAPGDSMDAGRWRLFVVLVVAGMVGSVVGYAWRKMRGRRQSTM